MQVMLWLLTVATHVVLLAARRTSQADVMETDILDTDQACCCKEALCDVNTLRTRKRSTHPTRVFAASSRAGNAATSSRSQSLMLKLRTKVFVKKLITSNTRFHRGLRRAR